MYIYYFLNEANALDSAKQNTKLFLYRGKIIRNYKTKYEITPIERENISKTSYKRIFLKLYVSPDQEIVYRYQAINYVQPSACNSGICRTLPECKTLY